jgi:hypothetical protein
MDPADGTQDVHFSVIVDAADKAIKVEKFNNGVD